MSQLTPGNIPPALNYAQAVMNRPPRRWGRAIFGWIIFVGLAVALFVVMNNRPAAANDLTLSEFEEQARNQNIAEIVIRQGELRGRFVKLVQTRANKMGAQTYRVEVPDGMESNWGFIEWVMRAAQQSSANVRFDARGNVLLNVLIPLIPWILIFGFIYIFIFRQLRGQSTQAKTPEPVRVIIVNPDSK